MNLETLALAVRNLLDPLPEMRCIVILADPATRRALIEVSGYDNGKDVLTDMLAHLQKLGDACGAEISVIRTTVPATGDPDQN